MYGAIYGDLVGSLYEYREFICHDKAAMLKASNKEVLITDESFISDDTILSIAVAEAYQKGLAYEENYRKYTLENATIINRDDYFKYYFSPSMIKWANGKKTAASFDNGALSRISSLGNLIDSTILLNNETILATTPTHNSPSAIKGALCVANIIYLARNKYPKEKIKDIVDRFFTYDYKFDLEDLRNNMVFNLTCDDTLPLCLYALFATNNFDDAIRLTLSLGGDTDTNCAIVGSMAESMYGMSDEEKQLVELHINEEYRKILKNTYIEK